MHVPGGAPSAHVDHYIRDLLPPRDLWPVFDYSAPNIGRYPDQLNAVELLLDAAVAAGYGDKNIYYFDGQAWTYRHLLDRVERIARVLVEDYGLVPGNRVLLRAENTPMGAACWLAVVRAGGIIVPTMPMLKAEELRRIMNRVQARFAFCALNLAEEMESALGDVPSLQRVGYFTPLGLGRSADADLDRDVENKPAGFRSVQTSADDIALITFTSGTTSAPKAAAHFHRDLMAVTDCFPQFYPVSEDDIVTGTPCFAFTYGIAAFLLFPLKYHASAALIAQAKPDLILDTIQRHHATSLYTVPTAYNSLLHEIDNYDISSLQKCASAGEHLTTPLFRRWREATEIKIVNGIGCTELLSHFICQTLDVERVGSMGLALPGYTACVVNDDGIPLPRGTCGRIAVRGPTGCRYLDDIERQKMFVLNGWNCPGDLVEQDEDGYFWYINRADDVIISSGYNISPQEVEQALVEHPLVSNCAVVGIPDTERGNLVRACVVLRDPSTATPETVRALQDFVKSRIAPYKYPRDIRFYDSLPQTPTGKIKRNLLRQD